MGTAAGQGALTHLVPLAFLLQIGTFTLFQETYHRPTFKYMHISGPKSDYDNRVLTFDRAQRAGLDDVGLGILYGLYDYRYEVRKLRDRGPESCIAFRTIGMRW